MSTGFNTRLTVLACSLSFSFISTSFAFETDLGSFGETELQVTMGDAVQTVCGGFVVNKDAESAQQIDLFTRCGEMVHSANDLLDKTVVAKSLGVSASELAGIIQQVAGEEVIAQSNVITDAMSGQNAMIGSRISTLMYRMTAANYNNSDDSYAFSNGRNILGMGASGDDVGVSENLSMFINGTAGKGDKDATDNEDGFDLDTGAVIFGVDYRISNDTVVGISFGWDSSDADYDVTQRVSGGKMEAESKTLSLYGLYNQEDYYISGILGFGQSNFDTSRRVLYTSNLPLTSEGADRHITSDTDSDQTSASITAGYQILQDSMTISPYVKISYLDIDIDAFDEQDSMTGGGLGLKYKEQSIESMKGVIGAQASWVVNKDFGVLSPYVIAEWHKEFEDEVNTILAQYIHDPRNNQIEFNSDAADSSYFNFAAGVSLVLPNSIQMFVDVSSIVGMEDFSYQSLSLGIRKAF